MSKWLGRYGKTLAGNCLPLFFDMEQSAHVLALAAWDMNPRYDDGVAVQDEYGN